MKLLDAVNKYRKMRELPSSDATIPENLMLEVCDACNYCCVFCPTAIQTQKSGNIDESLCYRIIEEAHIAGVQRLSLALSGEPLVNPKLEGYISYAKNLGYDYVYANTNGFLLNAGRAETLLESGLDSLKVSINAGTRETYQLIHGVDGFDQVVDNIKYFSERRKECKLFLSYVAIKHNRNEASIIKQLLSDYVDDILVFNAHTGGAPVDNNQLLGDDECSFVWPCGQLFNFCTISAQGYMIACCQDFYNWTVFADLNKVSFVDAWNSDAFVQFRKRHLAKDFDGTICKNCLYGANEDVVPLNATVSAYPVSTKRMEDVRRRNEILSSKCKE